MSFKHLEDTLSDENVLPYLGFHEEIQEPTRTVFGYALDIGSHLDSQNLSDRYVIVGGYAVLSNLMDAFGDDVAKIWRGSTDVDMAGDKQVLNSIRNGYSISNDRKSPNIENKRTIKLDTGGEKECKIDFYLGDSESKYGLSRMNEHFGVPLNVLRPEYIIGGKLKTPEEEIKHYGDILAMISVLEKKGENIQDYLSIFSHEDIDEFRKRICVAQKEFSKGRFGFFPSLNYMKALKKELHHRRSVKTN